MRTMNELFTITTAETPEQLRMARGLFIEYSLAIADVAACSLQFQKFDHELATLPGVYGPPKGRIYLAMTADMPCGCVALKPLPDLGPTVGEVKRMFVRESCRRQGVGHGLIERLIADARAIGYTLLKLDTGRSMLAAMHVYRTAGFVPCARYNQDPMEDTLWFERRL
jgi:putative acetyltransferase